MSDTTGESNDKRTDEEYRQYPFGLSARLMFFVIILVGLVGSGLGVYILETANLPRLADFVWVAGYGTTVFLVWFLWIRPLDLVGAVGQDTTPESTRKRDQPETDDGDGECISEPLDPSEAATTPEESTPSNGDDV